MKSASDLARQLTLALGDLRRVVVALSGGVDSSVVAAAAHRAGLEMAVAVTADSPSVPRWQLDTAQRVAAEIGIEHRVVATREGDRHEYRRNDQRRCYFCKDTLYATIAEYAARELTAADTDSGASVQPTIASGTNADDLGDYRPGIQAGHQAGVATPLADLGLGKSQVRLLASHFGLSNRDLPASPCLASRIAYQTEVTPERLKRVEQAEDWLRKRGFEELRVRLHDGELARIEVPRNEIPKLLQIDQHGRLTRAFQSFGFHYITIDTQGLQSGSMNRVLVSLGTTELASENKFTDRKEKSR